MFADSSPVWADTSKLKLGITSFALYVLHAWAFLHQNNTVTRTNSLKQRFFQRFECYTYIIPGKPKTFCKKKIKDAICRIIRYTVFKWSFVIF